MYLSLFKLKTHREHFPYHGAWAYPEGGHGVLGLTGDQQQPCLNSLSKRAIGTGAELHGHAQAKQAAG